MSERKAINKYYPPDWDPSQVPKKKKSANPNVDKVRLMVPFSMKCLQCTEYIASRRKFNARKETTNEKYMGIKLIRFHIKCPRCNHNLVFQTDPKSAGFIPVSGIQRNYESLASKNNIKAEETEEEMLQRLEKQDKEDQLYKDQQSHRKRNPLWQAPDPNKTTMASLEEKILEQQKMQETHDHLKFLEAKSRKLNSFGEDVAADQARTEVRLSMKRDFDPEDDEAFKKFPKKSLQEPTPSVPSPVSVLGKINVSKKNLERLRTKLKDSKAQQTEAKNTDATTSEAKVKAAPDLSASKVKEKHAVSVSKPSEPIEQNTSNSNVFDGYGSSSEGE